MATFRFRYQDSGDTKARARINAALGAADALAEDGRWREAIDALNGVNRVQSDREVERRLLQLRHDAFEHLEQSSPPPWPPSVSARVPSGSPPEVSPADLNAAIFTNSILEAGSLLVRGLIPSATVSQLVEGIDCAFAASDAADNGSVGGDDPWFEEFQPAPHLQKWMFGVRNFVRSTGGVFAADSPPVYFDLLEAVEKAGITALVTAHLGEQPALSVKKTTLRRVTSDSTNWNASWHQDGAFMGTNIRTVNLWLALTRCGDDAPGLDILPRRLDHIVETGTVGAIFDWAASPAKVEQAGEGVKVCRPIFEAGDALLFDHLFMHRTAAEPEMTRDRHGIEMWFFAPSLYPQKEIPLLV